MNGYQYWFYSIEVIEKEGDNPCIKSGIFTDLISNNPIQSYDEMNKLASRLNHEVVMVLNFNRI